MKDDIKNLKEISDLVLKDIYVTNELKKKTLELCKKEKSSILKPFLAAASSAAVIAVSLTGYQYFSHRTDSNLNNKQIVQNSNDKSSNHSVINNSNPINNNSNYTIKENNIDKNANNANSAPVRNNGIKDKTSPADTSIPTNTNDYAHLDKTLQNEAGKNGATGAATPSTPAPTDSSKDKNPSNVLTRAIPSTATFTDTLSTAEAEKYWGSKLPLPSYIPNNFELTNISIPRDNKEIYVKLSYSSNNNYFRITQNKNTKYTITGKPVDLNGTSANITQSKDETNADIIITQIMWVKDNIQYSIVGNISDVELINISKSMK